MDGFIVVTNEKSYFIQRLIHTCKGRCHPWKCSFPTTGDLTFQDIRIFVYLAGNCELPIFLKHFIHYFFLVLLFLSVTPALSQEVSDEQEPVKKSFWARLDSSRNARLTAGLPLFTPFIAPAFSPELGFLISGGGLYTFKLQKDNPDLERSSIPFSVGFSSNGSFQFNAKPTLYGKNDRYRVFGEIWFKDMPDNYWGIGFDRARDIELSESTTEYQRTWFRYYQKVMFRTGKNTFAGFAFEHNRTDAEDLAPLIVTEPNIVQFGTSIRNTGLGVAWQYDSRDIIVNAYKGLFLDFNFTSFGRVFGGQSNYEVLDVDYRQYKSLAKHRRVLAWQVRYRNAFGDVPWPEMSQLGNPFDLRGYRWGRFRDKAMVFGILEYRHMFSQTYNPKITFKDRAGFVAWVATGSIANNVGELTQWLPNAGVGFRFETEPRMNVRIDYGIGIDSSFLYISFNEAF